MVFQIQAKEAQKVGEEVREEPFAAEAMIYDPSSV
jgi:hypothetical protein